MMHAFEREQRGTPQPSADDGFMLAGLIVAIFLILLTLSIAAPRVAYDLRRDREVEAVHRGRQYVRAIQLYYKKLGHYPGSLEQLEKTNNIRYLRQRYADPMTGKQDFRLIPVGQNQTTVKGFFGLPLAGLPGGGGLGSASGLASPGLGTAGASGSPTSMVGANGALSATGVAGSSNTTGATGATGTSGTPSSAGGFGTSPIGSGTTPGSGFGSSSGFGSGSTGSPFMGVGMGTGGPAILDVNGEDDYARWEFLYDPRIELLKAKGALNAPGSVGAGSLGAPSGGPFVPPGPTPTVPFGTSPPATPAPPQPVNVTTPN